MRATYHLVMELQCINEMSPGPEDIGLPTDGFYEIDSAIQVRSCIDHETEWLLCFKDRWIIFDDFGVSRARDKLAAKLPGPRTRNTQAHLTYDGADCTSDDWAQVYMPLHRRCIRGQDYFLIRWKPVWVSEAEIDGLDQVLGSYKEHQLKRRTSLRKKAFNGNKWEGFMRVAFLDQFLDK